MGRTSNPSKAAESQIYSEMFGWSRAQISHFFWHQTRFDVLRELVCHVWQEETWLNCDIWAPAWRRPRPRAWFVWCWRVFPARVKKPRAARCQTVRTRLPAAAWKLNDVECDVWGEGGGRGSESLEGVYKQRLWICDLQTQCLSVHRCRTRLFVITWLEAAAAIFRRTMKISQLDFT